MKKLILGLMICGSSLALLTSCGIDGHNRAELRPINETDERIYGDRQDTKARQMYNEDKGDPTGEAATRVDSIRAKLYSR